MSKVQPFLAWGNPEAITIFNPGDRDGYRDLLWGTPGTITMFNPGDPEGYHHLLWRATAAFSAFSSAEAQEVDEPLSVPRPEVLYCAVHMAFAAWGAERPMCRLCWPAKNSSLRSHHRRRSGN